MVLEGLETLYVLAQEGTMGKAGSRLYISQSAVSKRIANLEARLGKKLIEPHGRHIRLTVEALELLENVEPELVRLKGLLFDHQHITDTSTLQIAASETVLAAYLGAFIREYLQHDSALNFSTHHTPLILEKVRSGEAALGVCAGRLANVSGLIIDELLEEELLLVYPQPLPSIRDLKILTIDLNNPANSYLQAQLMQIGLTPMMQMDSYFAVAHLGLSGVAPALVPRGIINVMDVSSHYIHSLPEPLSRPISLCYRPKTLQRTRIKKLREKLLASFK